MSWIRRLFGLCVHKWKTEGYTTVTSEGVNVGRAYYQHCEVCGNVRRKELTS